VVSVRHDSVAAIGFTISVGGSTTRRSTSRPRRSALEVRSSGP
jgi:hypothetical protein